MSTDVPGRSIKSRVLGPKKREKSTTLPGCHLLRSRTQTCPSSRSRVFSPGGIRSPNPFPRGTSTGGLPSAPTVKRTRWVHTCLLSGTLGTGTVRDLSEPVEGVTGRGESGFGSCRLTCLVVWSRTSQWGPTVRGVRYRGDDILRGDSWSGRLGCHGSRPNYWILSRGTPVLR